MAKFKRGSLTLARQVFNTPQLILADDLQNIAQYLVNRANGIEFEAESLETEKTDIEAFATDEERRERQLTRLGITNDGKRGNLDVTGTLVAKAGNIDADCMELTSYEGMYDKFAKQVSEGIEELVLHVDSGGGSAFSCFEMAKEVKDLAVKNDIKIYAFIDGLSASAAFAWTSIADEVIARPDSEIGSVGVVVQLINNSKMLENIGITRQFVCHGEQKVPFTADGDFSPQFISSIQKKVDKTGAEFSSFIANNRNMTVEAVLATQAEVFDSEEALSIGFIDKIMTKSEFFGTYLPSLSSKKDSVSIYGLTNDNKSTSEGNMPDKNKTDELLDNAHKTKTEDNVNMEQLTQLTEQNTQMSAQLTDMGKELSNYKEQVEKLTSELQSKEMAYRNEQRKASLEAALGKDNEEVAEMLASTESLSDEHFSKVVSTLAASQVNMQEKLEEKGGEGQDSDAKLGLSEQLAKRAQELNARKAH